MPFPCKTPHDATKLIFQRVLINLEHQSPIPKVVDDTMKAMQCTVADPLIVQSAQILEILVSSLERMFKERCLKFVILITMLNSKLSKI